MTGVYKRPAKSSQTPVTAEEVVAFMNENDKTWDDVREHLEAKRSEAVKVLVIRYEKLLRLSIAVDLMTTRALRNKEVVTMNLYLRQPEPEDDFASENYIVCKANAAIVHVGAYKTVKKYGPYDFSLPKTQSWRIRVFAQVMGEGPLYDDHEKAGNQKIARALVLAFPGKYITTTTLRKLYVNKQMDPAFAAVAKEIMEKKGWEKPLRKEDLIEEWHAEFDKQTALAQERKHTLKTALQYHVEPKC